MTGYASRVTRKHLGLCRCGKQMFATRQLARKQRDDTGRRMRAYQCGPYWHATSQSAKRAESWRTYGRATMTP